MHGASPCVSSMCRTARPANLRNRDLPVTEDEFRRAEVSHFVKWIRRDRINAALMLRDDSFVCGLCDEPRVGTEYRNGPGGGWEGEYTPSDEPDIRDCAPTGDLGMVELEEACVGNVGPSMTRPYPGCHRAFTCMHDGVIGHESRVGDGLPLKEGMVEVCSDPSCEVGRRFVHVSDPDGMTWGGKCDRVVAGNMYRSSSCERTCHGCGATRANRTDMYMCSGCHALAPYLRGGHGDLNRALLVKEAAATPVYCGIACQSSHWWSGADSHAAVCPRHDHAIYSVVKARVPGVYRSDDDVPFGAIQADGTSVPWLIRSSFHLHGLHGGMGYS